MSLNKFSLYIHWPFCLKKCPYCDFNSYAFEYDEAVWIEGLIDELDSYSEVFKNYELQTIFFGGGTPSLINPENIKKILQKVDSIWEIQDIEITIEVNPSSIETHSLEEFLKNGINRFSIGVQSLKNENLKFLGRLHDAEGAMKIAEYASKICENVSCDFMYSLPFDTLYSWRKDLDKIINFLLANDIKHTSVYQLVIEPNTSFEQAVRSSQWLPMNEDLQSQLYRYTNNAFYKLGWNFYEISNASANKAFECQHNLAYWNYNSYLGIGPGAHSRMHLNNDLGFEKFKFNNYKNPYKWKEFVKKGPKLLNEQKQLEELENLSKNEQLIEKLLMGFRLSDGIFLEKDDFEFINMENFELLMKKKFVKEKNGKHKLSLSGRLRLNSILKMLCY